MFFITGFIYLSVSDIQFSLSSVLHSPTTQAKWFYNGREVKPDSPFQIKTEKQKTTLRIPKSVPKNSGKFEVRAVNEVGEARTSGSVQIKGNANSTLVFIII